MIELLTFIQSKLVESSGIDRVYIDQAPQKTRFPYVVYQLPTSDPDYLREDFVLEVDIWGNNPDTTEIELITARIDESFNRLHHYDTGKLQADFYRLNRLMIPDPDPMIRRRQLRYEVKTYIGG